MKKFKKLIPAMVMLLIAAMLMGTTTYAWFSMNNKVTVSGMEVRTKVSSSLLVSGTTDEADFAASLSQTRTGILEPVSTVNGIDFYYHDTANNVAATGKATDSSATFIAYTESTDLDNSAAGKTQYDVAFNGNYGVSSSAVTTSTVEYGFIDYTFYLKATSTADNQIIGMTRCNLLYGGQPLSSSATIGSSAAVDSAAGKAWRVAVLSTAGQTTAAAAASANTAKTFLLALDGADNWDGKAVAAADAYGTATYGTAVEIESDIDAGATKYYKVIVRLYLEGQDKTCNNETYVNLTADYSLDVDFMMGIKTTEVVPVTLIGSAS